MSLDLETVVSFANTLVAHTSTLSSNTHADRKGGYLFLGLHGLSERHLLQIGVFSPDKDGWYKRLAQEKGHRLYSQWLRDPASSLSSWQTRQPELKQYGGAILFNSHTDRPHVISFSGINEHSDEAVSLSVGLQLGFTTDVARILEISDNPVYRELAPSLDLHSS